MCILSVYTVNTLLKVVGYYDLSVLSISVGFPKKRVWMGGGCGELYPIKNLFWIFFNFAKPLTTYQQKLAQEQQLDITRYQSWVQVG